MDFVKQYLIQCINAASNNLRITSEKIEVVTHIKEFILQAENLEEEIKEMKKITELSKFAIKLGDIHNYVAKNKIDFLKISDKFKEQSHSLVRDLGILLDRVNPEYYRVIEDKLKDECENCEEFQDDKTPLNNEENPNKQIKFDFKHNELKHTKEKDEILIEFEEKEGAFLFENFEEKIIKPIKDLDLLLNLIYENKIEIELIDKNSEIVTYNAKLSEAIGFDIISNMHIIFANALKLIKSKDLQVNKDVIECMRACLIVIVAVIKGKKVNITNYLNKAEKLGNYLNNNFEEKIKKGL